MTVEKFEPTIVYKDGGPHSRDGGSYSYLGVYSQKAFEQAVDEGWYKSLPEAISHEVDEDMPGLTREELKSKAIELGIKFDGRTTDSKLNRLITAALEA